MVMPNTERVRLALDHLRDGLQPVCEETWSGFYGDDWLNVVNSRLHHPEQKPSLRDVAFLFKGMKATWNETFGHGFSPAIRSLVFELTERAQHLGTPGRVLDRRHGPGARLHGAGARRVRQRSTSAEDP